MHVKKINQKSCYFIHRDLEALFELAPKVVTSTKCAVVFKKRRKPVLATDRLNRPTDHLLAATLADW